MFLYQLKNELWKLFAKKRTYIGFGMFLVAQNAIILMYRFTNVRKMYARTMEANGLLPSKYLSALTTSTFMVLVMAALLLPLYAALVGGDLVAKEAEDGSLRMILCRPISRARLLMLKWLAGVVFSFTLVLALGGFGLLFSSFWFPMKGLVTLPPLPFGAFEWAEGLQRYLGAHIMMVPGACTVMTLAFMFSCFNMKPAAATILALSLTLTSRIMEDLPFLSEYHNWYMTYHMGIWAQMFADRIPWWRIAESFVVLGGYNATFLLIGCTAFHVRDIKS